MCPMDQPFNIAVEMKWQYHIKCVLIYPRSTAWFWEKQNLSNWIIIDVDNILSSIRQLDHYWLIINETHMIKYNRNVIKIRYVSPNRCSWIYRSHIVASWYPFTPQTDPINTLSPRKNGRHFPDIFKCIFLNENAWISIKISLKFLPKVQLTIFQHGLR